jgi:iron complex transport system ATP-binding protein
MELSLQNIEVGYAGKPSLFSFNGELKLPSHKLTVIMGENGTGKSTLIKSIAGVLNLKSGKVLFSGEPIESISLKKQAETRAVMFTGRIKMPDVLVVDFLESANFSKVQLFEKTDKQVLLKALEFVEAEKFINTKIDDLSDGQYQRVALARALVQDTPILILDEPTAFLDYEAMRFLFEKLMELVNVHKKTVLISTHNVGFALNAAHEIWLIKNGGLAVGSPEDLETKAYFSNFRDTNLYPKNLIKKKTNFKLSDNSSELDCFLERGLMRLGYSINNESQNLLKVTQSEHGLSIKDEDRQQNFNSFKSFFEYLENNYD